MSGLIVAAAEIGDKTQLLSLLLVARYRKPWTVAGGILAATVLNHLGAALAGEGISRLIGPALLQYLLAASFVLMGLWLLRPDSIEEEAASRSYNGVFLTAAVLFFLAEMGDKTQVATVALGARYDGVAAVVAGTTAGMLFANLPVLLGGDAVMRRLPVVWAHRGAAALFIVLGAATLLLPWTGT